VLAIAVLAAAWLFVSDIHLDPAATTTVPAAAGSDANLALVQSAIDEMRRVDPHPPVVVIGGDFVAHRIDRTQVVPTIARVASLFDRAFPNAQFVIALGNNDAPCGDYGISAGSPFLREVAQAWAPLVNRRGAAPEFARTFARDGFYTARLPLPHTEAVVVYDVAWSPRAHACGAAAPDAGGAMLADLDRALTATPSERRWIVMHVPPGIDAFATVHVAQRLAVVSLLDRRALARFEALAADPARGVALLVAAHIHRFGYRILAAHGTHPVPLLSIPAISPIYGNAPSFLTVDVAADGTIHNAEEHAYRRGAWAEDGGLRTLGATTFSAGELLALQGRLARDPALRATFARLYDDGARSEIDAGNWRAYWCSATELAVAPFGRCMWARAKGGAQASP